MFIWNLQVFGGRGGDSGADGPRPGGGSGRFSNSPAADFQLPQGELKAALGAKGAPKSIDDSMKKANPYYSGGYADYSENCQRAVVAYELRRRGYDVMALPTHEGDQLPMGGKWMGAFQKAKSSTIKGNTQKQVQANLESKMKQGGNGSRYIVRVQSKTGNGGHVFNAEVKNGRAIFVDAQTNTKYSNKKLLNYVNIKNVQLVRVDNRRISDRAKKSVTKYKA